jgi:hypothetical protein
MSVKKKEDLRNKLIRELAKKGYSANRIQKELQKIGLGMRRQELLKKVREAKEVKKKPYPAKYIPKKYLRKYRERIEIAKKIAIYGTVDGKSRRIEMWGNRFELYEAVKVAIKHPPVERFTQTPAYRVDDVVDWSEEWDDRPLIKS